MKRESIRSIFHDFISDPIICQVDKDLKKDLSLLGPIPKFDYYIFVITKKRERK
jgi:hypothetical protein